ncbi:MAG: hypothetical protein PHT12_02325 [Patescibacteria group bacterium]|nr:hypothetical protein [Patescibacteria group bacterium]
MKVKPRDGQENKECPFKRCARLARKAAEVRVAADEAGKLLVECLCVQVAKAVRAAGELGSSPYTYMEHTIEVNGESRTVLITLKGLFHKSGNRPEDHDAIDARSEVPYWIAGVEETIASRLDGPQSWRVSVQICEQYFLRRKA